jgi:hypothetical protein
MQHNNLNALHNILIFLEPMTAGPDGRPEGKVLPVPEFAKAPADEEWTLGSAR